jgi:hypothetical protein
VLPSFRGAAFIYDKFVREQLRKHGLTAAGSAKSSSSSPAASPSSKDKDKPKNKFLAFVTPKKVRDPQHQIYASPVTPADHDVFSPLLFKYFLSLTEDAIGVLCLNVSGS